MGEPDFGIGADRFPPSEPPPPPPPGGVSGPCHWHGGRLAVVACSACDTPMCADCASPLTQPGAPPDAAACPTCAPRYGVPSSVPFEDPALGNWTGFWKTFGWAIGKPNALWRSLGPAPIGRAVVFAYLAALPALAVNVAGSVLSLSLQRATGGLESNPLLKNNPLFAELASNSSPQQLLLQNLLGNAVLFALTPVIALLWASLHHLVASMGGAQGGFGATFRAVCYCSSLAIFSMACFPCSTVPVWIWYSVVMVFALRRIHGLRPGAAVWAGIVPMLIFCVGCCAVIGLMAMAIAAAVQGL